MPDAPVLGRAAKPTPIAKKVKLDDAAFGARFSGPLVHQSVRAEQAARRRGTAATKTRGMVSGGGAKPWRQKGTGRARAGSTRSPIWTGGGVVFGPQPAPLHLQGQPQGAPRRAAQRAVAARRALDRDPRRGRLRRSQDEPGARPARRLGPAPRHARRAASRGVGGGAVLPQLYRVAVLSAAERRRDRPARAASLLISEAAWTS